MATTKAAGRGRLTAEQDRLVRRYLGFYDGPDIEDEADEVEGWEVDRALKAALGARWDGFLSAVRAGWRPKGWMLTPKEPGAFDRW